MGGCAGLILYVGRSGLCPRITLRPIGMLRYLGLAPGNVWRCVKTRIAPGVSRTAIYRRTRCDLVTTTVRIPRPYGCVRRPRNIMVIRIGARGVSDIVVFPSARRVGSIVAGPIHGVRRAGSRNCGGRARTDRRVTCTTHCFPRRIQGRRSYSAARSPGWHRAPRGKVTGL